MCAKTVFGLNLMSWYYLEINQSLNYLIVWHAERTGFNYISAHFFLCSPFPSLISSEVCSEDFTHGQNSLFNFLKFAEGMLLQQSCFQLFEVYLYKIPYNMYKENNNKDM